MPKSVVLEIGCSRMIQREKYSMGNEWINKANVEKALEVWIIDNLSPEKYINKITGDTYQLLKNIRMGFKYLDEEMINKLITSLIQRKLEYAAVI